MPGPVNWNSPINQSHPLNRGLVGWWLTKPRQDGESWWDLERRYGAFAQGYSVGDWHNESHPGGYGSLAFNTNDEYIIGPHANVLEPPIITVSVWINTLLIDAFREIISNGSNSGWRMRLDDSGTLTFLDRGATNIATTVNAITLGQWYHTVFTGDADGLKIYINGVNQEVTLQGGTAYGSPTPGTNILVGKDADFDEDWVGLLDDIRLYRRSLSESEVSELYRESATGWPRLLARLPRKIAAAVAITFVPESFVDSMTMANLPPQPTWKAVTYKT